MQSALYGEGPSEKFYGKQFISSMLFRPEKALQKFSYAISETQKIKHERQKLLECDLHATGTFCVFVLTTAMCISN
jgi:L-asparaginase/Glu-tRNA(Gln) amidotransferase subunit D